MVAAQEIGNPTPSALDAQGARSPRAPRAQDYDQDLEWLLLSGGVAMRERGTIAGVINQLECGGPAEGGNIDAAGSYIHPYTDQQLGTGKCIQGEVERHRWLSTAWFACSEETRKLLLLAHQAPPGEFRSDHGYGARDRWVKGSDHREGQHGPSRTGVDAHLGQPVVDTDQGGVRFGIAALAIALSPDPEKLLVACHDPDPLHKSGKRRGTVNREESERRRRLIKEAKRRADTALSPAWAEWFESKAAADPMRKNSERRASLGVWRGSEDCT